MSEGSVLEQLERVSADMEAGFKQARRILSFGEFVELFASDPLRHSRGAAHYMRDLFDHYGSVQIDRPWGQQTRYNLFDLPFLEDPEERREALVGQEAVQLEVYRSLSNFVREERPNRVVLLHGPNGSAKSTVAACLMRALEHYSTLDEGALYRFHWVFPSQSRIKGSIGFSGRKRNKERGPQDSYAHLADDEVDARLYMEVRDHPLLLLPENYRRRILEHCFQKTGHQPPRWLLSGSASHKARLVFEALLASYDGDLAEVLRHVQIERYFISRRYRVGAVTLGPQLSVDAGERQLTADRSLAALPPSLQSIPLFQAFGELIDAAGGLLEFSDLLKRPIDAFKYLQITAETGEVALNSQNVALNCVMMASGNELHLRAFREHPEFESFRGRFELIKAPYLMNWRDEQAIYDDQIVPRIKCHVAPHATQVAAMFAVLTRLRKPDRDRYHDQLANLVGDLKAAEKLDLYASGSAPERLSGESAKVLKSAISSIYAETENEIEYEGSFGASPREMRTVLLDAAQSPHYSCLSPFAVLDELDELCKRASEFGWLQVDRESGGYHDHQQFRAYLRDFLLDTLEDEVRAASGLVDQQRYNDLFDRYVTHVSYWVKGEKLRNPLTGNYEEPDERLMAEVEALLDSKDTKEIQRHALINRIAAFAIDHPGASIDSSVVFPAELKRIQDAVFNERRVAVAKLARDMLVYLKDGGSGLDSTRREAATKAIERMKELYGYADSSITDACAALARARFAELLA